jgi:hypothetical protein
MTRLEAIWLLFGRSLAGAYEYGNDQDIAKARDEAAKALRMLGVNDVEISAAERKAARSGVLW